MDFNVDGSDLWDSTSMQDVFIKDYFRVTTSFPIETNSTSLSKTFPDLNVSAPSEASLISIGKSVPVRVNKKDVKRVWNSKKKKPHKQTTSELNYMNSSSCSGNQITKNVKYVSNDTNTVSKSNKDQYDSKSKKRQLTTIETKKAEVGTNAPEKTNLKVKKHKKDVNESDSTYLSEDNDPENEDDSDDDTIRNELINTNTYKNLQKLLKLAPQLDPNFQGNTFKNSSELIDLGFSLSDDSNDSDLTEDNACKASEDNDSLTSGLSNTSMESEKDCNKNTAITQCILKDSELYERTSISKNNEGKGNILKNKAVEKLKAAKFRYLNEKLYTETGCDAFEYFQENVDEFEEYHSGYRLQVSKWPVNPVDEIIVNLQKLNRSTVVADLGCGTAKIAQVLSDRVVHSFDLVAMNKHVTPCDISKVPLPKGSVDVAVFCLSLMGTNLKDYLCEAHRILRLGGTLKIAEVESRIEDLNLFIKNISCLGFALEKKNTKHKLFVFLDFQKKKLKLKNSKSPDIVLKPCLYKKR